MAHDALSEGERDLIEKVRKAREARHNANLAAEQIGNAKSIWHDLNDAAQKAEADADAAWRKLANPELFMEAV